MTDIPTASSFPESFDTDDNLYLVHDSLRVRLAEDYSPGDTSILIEGNEDVIAKFPTTGLITLTEQCSEIDERAISFYYGSRTTASFDDLILLPQFTDSAKPKKVTNITQNVMAQHHNSIKDALVAIQTFVGVLGTTDTAPLGETLFGRINFLRKLILTPRAWFTMDTRIGLVPFCVNFTDQSFRLGDGEVVYIWDFGDGTASTVSVSEVISVTDEVPVGVHTVRDMDGGTITKCYTEPGIYTVVLSVTNEFGTDVVVFEEIIMARTESPEEAVIDFVPKNSQNVTTGDPVSGPYTTPPTIRSAANTFIEMEIPEGENLGNPGRSYGGELLDDDGFPIDPIIEYTWNLGDDLTHGNLPNTRASYSVGGIYDIELRVDTQFGSYRITQYEDAIDIVENKNLWLFILGSENAIGGGVARGYEFGLISETFKILGNQTLVISRDNSFLDYLSDTSVFHESAETRAKNEFARNVLITQQSVANSGDGGSAVMFWASGGDDISDQEILSTKFNGFDDTYITLDSIVNRPWNWAALAASDFVYFLFGTQENTTPAGTNLALNKRVDFNLQSEFSDTPITLTTASFTNGGNELLSHPSSFDDDGIPTNGYFATYRTAWKDSTGYILRNSAVNEFFRMADFYKTEGSISDPFVTITKLPDIAGTAKLEGQLVSMFNGIYFFNNSGEVSAWNPLSSVWEVGRTSSASISFRSLQDTNVSAFDDKSNTLLAASDGDRVAYLSYDYSASAFIKFNGTDQTFASAGTRPTGTQFALGIY